MVLSRRKMFLDVRLLGKGAMVGVLPGRLGPINAVAMLVPVMTALEGYPLARQG